MGNETEGTEAEETPPNAGLREYALSPLPTTPSQGAPFTSLHFSCGSWDPAQSSCLIKESASI